MPESVNVNCVSWVGAGTVAEIIPEAGTTPEATVITGPAGTAVQV